LPPETCSGDNSGWGVRAISRNDDARIGLAQIYCANSGPNSIAELL